MTNKKISYLSAANPPLTDSDLLEVEQPAEPAGTRSRKLTLSQVITWILSKTHTMTAAINEAMAPEVASAATVNIGALVGNVAHVTGTTTIIAFDIVQAGTVRRLIFNAALILTHNATSLILPTSTNITTAAGDSATFVSEGAGNWRCVSYQRADGTPLAGGSGGGGDLEKIAEVLVTGSAVTDIDFTGLDLNAACIYRIEAYIVPGTTGTHIISLLYNGDTTYSNYTRQYLGYISATADAGKDANPYIFFAAGIPDTSNPFAFGTTIRKVAGAKPLAETGFGATVYTDGSIFGTMSVTRWNNTANVTAIKLRNSATNGFGVGTLIRLYRMN